jgi:hypothetical protein
MSLAEYRTSTAVDVSLVDPFATRLLGLLEHFGGRVLVMSGRRDAAEGKRLYDLWIAGEGNYAAFPGTSLHEKGQAADLRIVGSVSWRMVHAEGEIRGVKFPLKDHPDPAKRENWHAEADHAWIESEEIPDMTKEEFAAAIGATIHPVTGQVCVPLINDRFDGYDLWPFAAAVAYTHEEAKRNRYGK